MNELDELRIKVKLLKEQLQETQDELAKWKLRAQTAERRPVACHHGRVGDCQSCDAENI